MPFCGHVSRQFNSSTSLVQVPQGTTIAIVVFTRFTVWRAGGRAGGRVWLKLGSNHGVIQRPSASCDALQGLSETSKVRNSTQILRDSCVTKSHQMRAPLCGEEQEKKT